MAMHVYARIRAFYAIGFLSLTLLALAAPGCYPGDLLGQGGDVGPHHYEPNYSLAAPAHSPELPCGDADTSHLCLAVNFVAYQRPDSGTIVTRNQALGNVSQVNSVWAQCRIQFYVQSYAAVDPASRGLPYQPSANAELNGVRKAFSDASQLLVVTTGQWQGELGSQGANAWTVLPSVGPFGVVMEDMSGSAGNLIAHELGHYLNLDHENDIYNAMNPIIYGNSINLTDSQCAEARATAISFWGAMLR
jgi:hypothetical protein